MAMNTSDLLVDLLEQNCRPDWPVWPCILGNVAGLSSTTLWFLVLLPQVWFNFRRKSVEGLSVLWATANFTASLINLFFVFLYVHIPLYGQISSVYCPILEFTLLVQFWIYGQHRLKVKLIYAMVCLLVWGLVVMLQVGFKAFEYLEWAAIALWCIETFPQVLLNMKLRSTSGQARASVLIAMTGKTTDLMANNLLVIPIHYVIMTYFSSSVAYVNGLQVAWYYQGSEQEGAAQSYDVKETPTPANVSIQAPNIRSTENLIGDNHDNRRTCILCIRVFGFALLSLLLVVCVCVLVWNTRSWLALLAPLGIILVLGTAFVVFNWRYVKHHLL